MERWTAQHSQEAAAVLTGTCCPMSANRARHDLLKMWVLPYWYIWGLWCCPSEVRLTDLENMGPKSPEKFRAGATHCR